MYHQERAKLLAEVTCPYDNAHKMPKQRLMWHIAKGCKAKRENGHLFSICKFNSMHIFPTEKLQEHESECRDNFRNNRYED